MKKKYPGTSRGAKPQVFSLRRAVTPDPGPCVCPLAGFCQRFNREMTGRVHQICQGAVLTPERCAAYRQNWARLARLAKRPKA